MTRGTRPNLSLILQPEELAYIREHWHNHKSAAIHAGLRQLMRETAGRAEELDPKMVLEWIAQAGEAQAKMLRDVLAEADAWTIIMDLHAIVDAWGAAHAAMSRIHWEAVDAPGPDAGDTPAALAWQPVDEVLEVDEIDQP